MTSDNPPDRFHNDDGNHLYKVAECSCGGAWYAGDDGAIRHPAPASR